MSEEIIGPNPCSECGGEYGEHSKGCSMTSPNPDNAVKWEEIAKSRAKSLLADGHWSHDHYDATGLEEITSKLILSAIQKAHKQDLELPGGVEANTHEGHKPWIEGCLTRLNQCINLDAPRDVLLGELRLLKKFLSSPGLSSNAEGASLPNAQQNALLSKLEYCWHTSDNRFVCPLCFEKPHKPDCAFLKLGTPTAASESTHGGTVAEEPEISIAIHVAIYSYKEATGNYPTEVWLGVKEDREFAKYIETLPLVTLRPSEARLYEGKRRFAGCEILRSLELGIRAGKTIPSIATANQPTPPILENEVGYSVHKASCPYEHGGACTCETSSPASLLRVTEQLWAKIERLTRACEKEFESVQRLDEQVEQLRRERDERLSKEPITEKARILQKAGEVADFVWNAIRENAKKVELRVTDYFDFANGRNIIEDNIRAPLLSEMLRCSDADRVSSEEVSALRAQLKQARDALIEIGENKLRQGDSIWMRDKAAAALTQLEENKKDSGIKEP